MPFLFKQPNYERLRDTFAERRRPLVFWVGAGLSRPAGLPTWTQLRDILISQALETAVTLSRTEGDRLEDALTQAKRAASLWDSFEILKSIMGVADFNASIRQVFAKAETCVIPPLYLDIWRLKPVSGMVTLNIDNLVQRAHRLIRPSEDINSFIARDAGDYVHMVSAHKPFIANLHGIHPSVTSWIFTRTDLARLEKNAAYNQFKRFIFSNVTVVFLGISADDVAAGGALSALTKMGLDLGQHFWITDRTDARTTSWGSAANLQLIRYEADNGTDHISPIKALFADLQSYISLDDKAPVIVPRIKASAVLPQPEEMKLMDDNTLRETLASYSKAIIERNQGATDCDDYRSFIASQSRFIHNAWHITEKAPYNEFFGYQVLDRIAHGPFSSVWRVMDTQGAQYALKIVNIDQLDRGPGIESFRRGVQCQEFLTNADVPGSTRLREAFEIPSGVVTEFVEGDNLQDVVNSARFNFWAEMLPVLINVCQTLEMSHNLPQGVLHRDIRPSNIMVPFFYWDEAALDALKLDKHSAILLNYDLAWHVKATGRTIAGNLAQAGFYAPEQIQSSESSLARTTLVDSYGVGMTIFFCFSGATPPPGGSTASEWNSILAARFHSDPTIRWRSATERLKRLVDHATKPIWQERASISSIIAELKVIRSAIFGDLAGVTPDVWAEEVFSRTIQSDYQASEDGRSFHKQLLRGRTIEVGGNFSSNVIEMRFVNVATESVDRGDGKKWKGKLDSAKQILASGGWTVSPDTRAGHLDLSLIASFPVPRLANDANRACDTLARALSQVRLD